MDIGTIVIYVTDATPLVARCEDAPAQGYRFVPATNATALIPAAQQVLALEGVQGTEDGVYLCPLELMEQAEFPPLTVPGDLISFARARDILYPDLPPNTGWQRVRRDVNAGRLRAYRVELDADAREYVSRTAALQLRRNMESEVTA
jgi:hypothetical protein